MIFEGEIVRQDRDYDFWYGFSNDTLSKYCDAFNLPKSGTKKEKAARLCFAWELGYEAKGSDDVNIALEEEYNRKLTIGNFTITDPRKISDVDCETGPPANLSAFDRHQIIDYVSRNPFIAPADVQDLNKYTATVAYTLWKDGRVSQLRNHLFTNGPCVVVSAKCQSTMMTHTYNIWVALNSISADIYTCHCNCLAGLAGYCKHVFAVLFALEFYSDTNESHPSCTSMPRQWGQQASGSAVPPTPTTEISLEKAVLDYTPQRKLKNPAVGSYVSTDEGMSTDDRQDLLKKLTDDFQNCAIAVVHSKSASEKCTVQTIKSFVYEWKSKPDLSVEEKCAGCFSNIKDYFTLDLLQQVELETREQSRNPQWFEHRIYRITASIAGEILAAVNRFEQSYAKLPAGVRRLYTDIYKYFDSLNGEDKENVLVKLLPKSWMLKLEGAQYDGPASRYGRENESNGLQEYLKQHKAGGCPDATLETSGGLVVPAEWPYLGASLDGILKCTKHWKRVVEVKCPYRCSNNLPPSQRKSLLDTLPLNEETGRLAVNEHKWQQILQMAVINIENNDLFFWSEESSFIELVEWDQRKWDMALDRLEWYFKNVILYSALK